MDHSVRRSLTVLLLVPFAACRVGPVGPGSKHVVEIGRRGAAPGRFNFPRAVVVTANDELLVIDKTGRIQRLSQDGRSLGVWSVPAAENGTPTGAALDRSGDLLVADTHYSRILRFKADGTSWTAFGRHGEGQGKMICPTDVAVDGEGNVFVTNYGGRDKIIKFSSDGAFVAEWGGTGDRPGQFRRPMALTILDGGEIVVADSCNHRIQRFDLAGRLLGVWGSVGQAKGQLNYPYDVEPGPKGELYVCEYGNNRISKFTRDGRCTGVLGGPGNELGRFRGPWSLAIGRTGCLYVADTYNHRIQRFAAGAF